MSEKPMSTAPENALRWIAYIAGIHYAGGAFDPQHMRSLQWLAADALAGKPMVEFEAAMERARIKGAQLAADLKAAGVFD